MNYRRIYSELIMRAWRRGGVEGYKERHHIIPRCQGGGNDKANLVDLTASEHYIAHLLLVKMYPDFYKLTFPIFMMGSSLGKEARSKLYEAIKIAASEGRKGKIVSKETRAKLSAAGMGRFVSEETRAKRSILLKGKTRTEESRAKMRAAQKGKKHTEETRAKMRAAQKGRKHTEEAKAKVSVANKGRKFSNETKAKMSSAKKGTKRTPEAIAKMLITRAKNKERKELLQFWCAV